MKKEIQKNEKKSYKRSISINIHYANVLSPSHIYAHTHTHIEHDAEVGSVKKRE
jgi:hypothetical protein